MFKSAKSMQKAALVVVSAALILLNTGCSKKPAKITETEYLEKMVTSDMAGHGYEVQDIRIRVPKLTRQTTNHKGQLLQLLTIEGTYDVTFQYRPKGSQDKWEDGQKNYVVTFDRGEWRSQELAKE